MHARTFFRAAKLRGIVDIAGLMAGVDEVGRGPLAGPVVAAAVILEEKGTIRGLNDSKLLTAEELERLDHCAIEILDSRRQGDLTVGDGLTVAGAEQDLSVTVQSPDTWANA